MDKKDFNLKSFNRDAQQAVSKSGFDFCRLLVQSYHRDLSVSARYCPPKVYCRLDEDLNVQMVEDDGSDSFYYGVSPLLDSDEIRAAVLRMRITDEPSLDDFIAHRCRWFMLHEDQQRYLLPLARYVVTVMASHYGIKTEIESAEFKKLKDQMKSAGLNEQQLDTFMWHEGNTMTIAGLLPQQAVSVLEKRRYSNLNGRKLQESVSLEEAFENHTVLVKGESYYSGVLLRPMEICVLKNTEDGCDISSVCFNIERTTYAVSSAFNMDLSRHPLLASSKEMIDEFMNQDQLSRVRLREAFEELEKKEVSSQQLIEAVNEYLRTSNNPNQIGVSANVVTSDGYLLIRRQKKDAMVYPGVSGNAEIADSRVSFYNNSVYADYPEIKLDDYRIDFFGEIRRKAYGQLGIELSKPHWECYGILMFGNTEENSSDRRMRFSLVFENKSELSFDEIEKISAKTELSAERDILGLKIHAEKNFLNTLKRKIGGFFREVVEQKNFIESILLYIVFVQMFIRAIDEPGSEEGWLLVRLFKLYRREYGYKGLVSFMIASSVILVTLYGFLSYVVSRFIHRKNVRSMTFYRSAGCEDIGLRIRKLFGSSPFYPAGYAAIKLYGDNQVHDAFF